MTTAMEQLGFWSPWLLSHWFWPMLWQSSLLIGVLFIIDFSLRRKLRPAVRYALWLVLLVKLILPPSLALPTGIAWWFRPTAVTPVRPRAATVIVSYGPTVQPKPNSEAPTVTPPPPPPLPVAAWALMGSSLLSLALMVWMLLRWGQVARTASRATAAPDWLNALLGETKTSVGIHRPIRLRLIAKSMSPAAYGFFGPVILLPQALTHLPAGKLRAVLLHELIHLRRGDVWVNCVQALLQILYWWHPLLWLANARIRRLREEAVDDAVMLTLRDDASDYAPTLLEVARLALQRPLASLGLVGILESKTALRRRIERLVDFRAPRRAGMTLASVVGLGLFTALAVPMGEPPATPQRLGDTGSAQTNPWPDPRFEGYAEVRVEPQFYIADEASLRTVIPGLVDGESPLVLSSNQLAELDAKLHQANAQPASANPPLTFAKFSGGRFFWHVGGTTNNTVNYHTREVGSRTVVTGAEVRLATTLPEWVPLDFGVVSWTDGNQLRCELELAWSSSNNAVQQAAIVLPEHGAAVWAQPVGPFSGKHEVVILRRDSAPTPLQQGLSRVASSSVPNQSALGSSISNQPSAAALMENFLKAQTKVQDGKLLFEMGKLDEAEVNLHQALVLNPQSQAAQYYLNLVQEARRQPVNNTANPVSYPEAHAGNDSAASRKALYSKLSQIRLDAISFNNTPLRDVLQELTDRSRALDPQKRGIHFIINNHVASPAATTTGIQGPTPIDPTTGLPLPRNAPTEQDDIADASIKILPALADVTLADTLEAIVKVADKRIKYSVEAYAVVFSVKRFEPQPLYTRVIKVDPNTFKQGLEGVTGFDWGGIAQPTAPGSPITGLTRTNDMAQTQVRKFFLSMGVDLTPPKSIFFNDREGTLVIRASLQDLDTIEQAVQVLNITPPQIHIKAKFIAVPTESLLELQSNIFHKPEDVPKQGDMLLTVPQTQVLLKALESNPNVDLIGEASVTTLSGRQTQVQVDPDLWQQLIKTNKEPSPGFGGATGQEIRLTNPPPFAVELDVVASAANGPNILIAGTALAFEFVGYDPPERTNRWDTYLNGRLQGSLPLPHYRVHELPFNYTIFDGQTLLLGGFLSDSQKSKSVPDQAQKSLLVLITPTLIDPAGNRIHSDDTPPK